MQLLHAGCRLLLHAHRHAGYQSSMLMASVHVEPGTLMLAVTGSCSLTCTHTAQAERMISQKSKL